MLLYDNELSGNCYKVRLLFAQLGIDYECVEVDVFDRSDRPQLLASLNPGLRIPTVVLDDGRPLAESNAILQYFADGTPLLPADPFERAQVLQWQFFEQYSHEPYIATARFIAVYLGLPVSRRAEYDAKQIGGHAALRVMESHLSHHDYFVGERFTIADISLYGYTHVADEGGFPLDAYPRIKRWLARIAALPRHVTMEDA